jgi:glucose/arabinose dehydrogenase
MVETDRHQSIGCREQGTPTAFREGWVPMRFLPSITEPKPGRSAWRIDKEGALLVADDVGNTVWRVTPTAEAAGL